ncbi:MAG: CHRD domain-containing protein [Nitrosopumilus sp.]|nr:CHRD domain-containing protein [Nitrosopumilus sp.]
MNTKQLLGISIGAIFAISLFAAVSLQEAEAKKPDQIGKPDFISHLNWKQTVPFEKGNTAGAIAKFWWNDDKSGLYYQFHYNHLNLESDFSDYLLEDAEYKGATDAIIKIHIHMNEKGIQGPHVLNVFGGPSEDDSDLVIDTEARTISGKYDDGDENLNAPCGSCTDGVRDSGDSVAFTDEDELTGKIPIDELCLGNLYLNVHTAEHAPGGLRGQIIPNPNACD